MRRVSQLYLYLLAGTTTIESVHSVGEVIHQYRENKN